jgi:hypothetical protein
MRHKLNLTARSIAVRSASLCALFTAVCMALGAGASYGGATAGSFQFEETFSDTVTNYPCSGGAPVTMTGTVTTKGHFTETDPRHFSVHGTNSSEYRADFGDGRYALGEESDHFSLSFNLLRPVAVDTNAQQETAMLYAPDGQPIGTITVHVIFHVTYSDANGNFEPDPGEITTTFRRIRVRCP